MLQNGLNIVYTAGLIFLAAGLGKLFLYKSRIRFASFWEIFVFSTGTGFGILSYAVFFLGASQCLYPVAIYSLIGLSAILSLTGWHIYRSTPEKTFAEKNPLSFYDYSLIIVLAAFLLTCLLIVLTPAIGNDSLSYHLAVPRLFIKHHGFYFIPGNLFSNYPLNSEMLFLIGLAIGNDVLVKMIHFSMTLLILLSMWQFTGHHLKKTRFMPLSLLVFFTIPSVFVNAHMAYNDQTTTFFSFLAIYAFVNWFSRKQTGWLILCGIFSGLVMATKYSGLFLPFLACLGILCGSRNTKNGYYSVFHLLCIYLICAMLVGAPFYIKNWIITDNPFYPFFYKIFDGRGWDLAQARYYDLFLHSLGMGRRLLDYLILPWNLSFNARMYSPQFDGVLGPVFILTLPFAMGIRNIPMGIRIAMVYCLFTFLFWASTAQQIRYLIPVFPFLSIMTGYILSYYSRKKIIFWILAVFISAGLGFNVHHIVKDVIKVKPMRVLTGIEDRDAFLNRMIPSYAMFKYINNKLPEDSKIFFIYMKNPGFLCDPSYYSDSMFESYTIEKILGASATPKEVRASLKQMGFTHILYDINYIFGEISTLTDRQKALFFTFQKKHLELIKTEKQIYHLYRLT